MNSSQDGVVSSQAEALFCSESTVVTEKKKKREREKTEKMRGLITKTRKNENAKFSTMFKKHIPASVTQRKANRVCVLLPGLG